MAIDPISAGLGLVDKFIGKFVKDKDLAAKLQAEARSEEFKGELSLLTGQMEVNKVEAAHKSLFVAGWRPAVGWVCVIAMGYAYVLSPLMIFVVTLIMDVPPEFPELNISALMPVLMGILGLGAMRTAEKFKGVQREK